MITRVPYLITFLALMLCFLSPKPANAAEDNIYILGAGDRVRMIVYGQDDISDEYEIDGSGALTLPLIGEVIGGGLSVRKLEDAITNAYKGDYFVNPQVNIEVIDFRPFFILGEVKTPGNYPYISGMTVLQAVSVAGGYTYRAKKSDIKLHRIVNGVKKEISVKEESNIFPSDVIHVEERFF